jgi:ADP-ribose pyrophosphatase YjhB (NUDIX family)
MKKILGYFILLNIVPLVFCLFTLANNEPRENSHYVQINFISHQWSGSLENKEPDKCEEWKWVPISELPTEIFYAHEPILRAFKAGQSYLEVPLEKK